MKDIIGKALLDYYHKNYTEDIVTWTSISEEDILPIGYLFRNYDSMPPLEQKALQCCKGTILDVGCGAGSHSLYLQQQGFDVKGIDISKGAIEVCQHRGITNAKQLDLLDETAFFDTLLLLMNGTGIFQTLAKTTKYLHHLKSLLHPNGQILIDSSDISYMYRNDDGSLWLDISKNYYGELDYFISYKDELEVPLKWLYLDFDTLQHQCNDCGLHCEKIMDGDHYDYLARITI